jgi:hypothetical protein
MNYVQEEKHENRQDQESESPLVPVSNHHIVFIQFPTVDGCNDLKKATMT